jgi:hypothetical protein
MYKTPIRILFLSLLLCAGFLSGATSAIPLFFDGINQNDLQITRSAPDSTKRGTRKSSIKAGQKQKGNAPGASAEVRPVKEQNASWQQMYYAGEPMKIGNQTQFLFDDYIVEDRYGLKRVVGTVEKYAGNPLSMGEDKPWEKITDSWGGAYLNHVIYDPQEKIYKGWYLVYRHEKTYNYSTLYAESKDGISWTKPELDFFKIDGRKTNYVLHQEQETALMQNVSLDHNAKNPDRRFMALVKMVPPGEKIRCIVRMFSPDGKKWTLAPEPVLFRGASDGSYSLVSDTATGRWLLYRRPATNAMPGDGMGIYGGASPLNPAKIGLNIKRRVSLTQSTDMKNWTYPRGINILDELDDEKVQILGNGMDIDWATVDHVDGVFFGFLHLMDNLTMTNPRQNQLMFSRDGIEWRRLPQRPQFIENGSPGEWDSGSIGSISLVPQDDRYRIYYTGANLTQGEKRIPRFTANGLAYIGKNRFVGQQAGPNGGYLLTREFILDGSQLELNFSSQVKVPPTAWGRVIKAEILQAPNDQVPATPLPGFAMKDCDPITTVDSFHQAVTWNGSADLSSLKGKKVYVRFYIQNSTLYTFKLSN